MPCQKIYFSISSKFHCYRHGKKIENSNTLETNLKALPASSELLDFFLRQIELVQLREDLLTEVLAEALPRVTTVANLLRKIFHFIFKQCYDIKY